MAAYQHANERQAKAGLVQIALNVHMALTGASDLYEGIQEDVSYLQKVIDEWDPCTCAFEAAVLALAFAALADGVEVCKRIEEGKA